ncbi:aminopeptidase N [Rubrivivax gelatinosus]|uniref:Aminopeptidase N n=1 Tax=Rubrivivax gelatinosus (strain NBRC 100245 / IL144) TaxID=983917 RepID=I0HQA1_RUBGI|nr:aminopeptidase N [Rubrivivax gelatinosus]BAL95188.1 aminopeptidase N PepN [Rubrivivax gelatinosus IL144]
MREGPAIVVHRQDYAAPAYWIRKVELCFDLDPVKTIVSSKLHIERNPAAEPQPLKLHGEDVTVLRVMAAGESVSFRHEDKLLVIDNPPAGEQFVLEIRNTCSPEKNTQLSGLYTSGSGFFTQCEAEGFRRITYFLDRPDVMAVYTVTLRADKKKYPVLLSNGNLVEQGELDNGRHFAVWHDPFPKPSYLFALVAADLVCREQKIRTRAGKEHLLQVFVRRGDLGKTEHAMASLVASVVWDEARFGLPLDLERFMIVAVEDFNMGAMENKGLNIFNTKYVLASPATATDVDFAGIESVVGHEYFHNWTGNRITCRDWFQLSLKEGLTVFRDQEFSMDMAGAPSARAVKRIEDVRALRASQFPEDAGAMAHPVRPDSYAAIDNFYTPTVYEKGAEVVRMMQTLVGRQGFERGITLYFERHDGQAVTCDDFAQAIADANPGSELATRLESFKRWYSQAGTPRLKARGVYDAEARRYTLTLAQTALPSPGQPTKEPFVIPVLAALLGRDGRTLAAERLLVLDSAEQQFVFDEVDAEPVPSLLRGFSAPVILDDGLADAELLTLLAHDSDAFNRWEAGQRLALARLLAAVAETAPVTLDEAFVEAMRSVLRDPALDPAFKEMALTLPSEGYVAEQLATFDPQRIHAVREQFREQLASALHADWAVAFEANLVREGYAPTPAQAGRRALANLALAMLCLHSVRSGNPVWPGRAYQRVKDASNMTDRIGALAALVHSHSELAEPALERFHAIAGGEPLVVDKWFALQAQASEPLGAGQGRSFARAKALLKHPDFSLKNPNRARSLIFQLCMNNPAAFHRADAAGYVFWAERMFELDAINPQVAARLARVMDRWTALAEPYRSAAREALVRVAAKPDLSDDVREVLGRALEAQQ